MQTLMGYEFQSTLWEDFTIADMFGYDAIKDTFDRVFDEWKSNYVYLTELVIVTNWKIWEWYEKDDKIGRLYNELWEKADAYAVENLKGEELSFFFRVTD